MKKADLFIIDAIIALAVLVAVLLYVQPYFNSSSNQQNRLNELGNYAEQSIVLLRNTNVSSLGKDEMDIIPESVRCPDCRLSRQFALLIISNNGEIVKNISNQSLSNLIPNLYGFSISLIGENYEKEIIIRNSSENLNLAAQRTLVSGLENPNNPEDLMLLQVKVWG